MVLKTWKVLGELLLLSQQWKTRNFCSDISKGIRPSSKRIEQFGDEREGQASKRQTFSSGLLPEHLFTFGVDLPTSAKVIKTISRVTIPIQVTLICGQLTLKASLNIRHVSTDVIRKQIKTSVDRRQPRVLHRTPDSYLPFVISREMQTCGVVHQHRELVS